MPVQNLQDALTEEIQDLLHAEHQISKALPKMAEKAHNSELREAFQQHQKETEGQIQRLEQVCQVLGISPDPKKCEGIRGILAEGEEHMGEEMDPEVMDAMLIAAAQKVEHYEISSYGSVRSWTELLQNTQARDLLDQTLNEEKDTDKKLTQLAMNMVNTQAKAQA